MSIRALALVGLAGLAIAAGGAGAEEEGGSSAFLTPLEPYEVREIVRNLRDRDGTYLPPSAQFYRLEPERERTLVAILENAPVEDPENGVFHDDAASPAIVPLTVDGIETRFRVVRSPVMDGKLRERFPDIRSYRGQAIPTGDPPNGGAATVRLIHVPGAIFARVSRPGSTLLIQSWFRDRLHAEFAEGSLPMSFLPTLCALRDDPQDPPAPEPVSGPDRLRVYRLALGVTDGYLRRFPPDPKARLRAVVLEMNKAVSQLDHIYEKELGIRFLLVSETLALVAAPLAEPDGSPSDEDLLRIQAHYDEGVQVDPERYDVGHVFGTCAGGRAQIRGAGRTGMKAMGISPMAPDTLWNTVAFLAHEMGHQFGATHTFDDCPGYNGGRYPLTAHEPGSGRTIMSYRPMPEPYFHSVSLGQIRSHAARYPPRLEAGPPPGNRPPRARAGAVIDVPPGTSFALSARGDDDASDELTYAWEQIVDTLAGQRPRFVAGRPSLRPERELPGGYVPDPQTQNPVQLRFRVTVRDNRSCGGGTAFDDVSVRVHPEALPLRVVRPRARQRAFRNVAVRWTVDPEAPVSAEVDLVLLPDGDAETDWWPPIRTENDGQEVFPLPDGYELHRAKIRVRAADGSYFADSARFRVQPSGPGAIRVDPDLLDADDLSHGRFSRLFVLGEASEWAKELGAVLGLAAESLADEKELIGILDLADPRQSVLLLTAERGDENAEKPLLPEDPAELIRELDELLDRLKRALRK